MTQQNQSIHMAPVIRSMLAGGVIAFAVIAFFVFSVNEPKPEWSRFWMVRPLIITPLAGTIGGLVYYIISRFGNEGGWKKAASVVCGILAYVVILWLGTVLGLDGTLWN